MTASEILDQLNTLTAHVKDLIAGNSFYEEDGLAEYVTSGDDDTKVLMAGKGYNSHVGVLSSVKDTGNGYIFFFPSHSSTEQDNYVCVDYAEADYMRKLLSFLHKEQST